MTIQDESYIRQYVKQALAGVKLEQPDKTKVNGAYEALLSLSEAQKLGGDLHETWSIITRNWPDYEQYAPIPSKWLVYDVAALRKLPPLEYLVSGMIVAGGFNVMFGASGVGKSFVALGITEKLSHTMRVAYVMGEGASGYASRLGALEARNGHKAGDMLFIPGAVNLMERCEVEQFIEDVIELHKPRLIVFDTLARCMVGGDENSSRDMGIVIDHCGLVQKQNCAILMIHHTGKNGSGERGSSALRGAADSMIDLNRYDNVITIESSKLKDGQEFNTYHVQLMPFASSVCAVPLEKISPDERNKITTFQYRILEILAMDIFYDTGCRSPLIRSQMNPPPAESTFFKAANVLLRNGLLKRSKQGEPYLITMDGMDALKARVTAAKQIAQAKKDSTESL